MVWLFLSMFILNLYIFTNIMSSFVVYLPSLVHVRWRWYSLGHCAQYFVFATSTVLTGKRWAMCIIACILVASFATGDAALRRLNATHQKVDISSLVVPILPSFDVTWTIRSQCPWNPLQQLCMKSLRYSQCDFLQYFSVIFMSVNK